MNNFVCFQKFAKNPPNQNNLKESHYYALMQGEIHAKNMWKDEINRSQKVGNEPGCQSDEDQLKWGKGVLQKQVLVALCKDFCLGYHRSCSSSYILWSSRLLWPHMITIIAATHLENMEHPTSKLQRKSKEGRQMCREVLPGFFQKSLRLNIMLTLMHGGGGDDDGNDDKNTE